ncbi:MAG: N-acetyltransferase family protein [Sneathiella sp.]
MPSLSLEIRDVIPSDISAIHKIYEEQVLNGISSWEEEPPSAKELLRRCQAIQESGYPYRVALLNGDLIGYCYASAYRPRVGYRFVVENSIYLAKQARGTGAAQQLMHDLIEHCIELGYRQMIAIVGGSDNHASLKFHEKMGFVQVGLLPSIGFKFGDWLDSVILQLQLGDGGRALPKESRQISGS